MSNIFARLYFLPYKVKSFAVEDENGDFTILINEQLSIEDRWKAFAHEMSHIESLDFEEHSASDCEWKETERHKKNAKKNEIAQRIWADN